MKLSVTKTILNPSWLPSPIVIVASRGWSSAFEGRVLGALVGKLFVTGNSSVEELQVIADSVVESIDGTIAVATVTVLGEACTAQSSSSHQP